MGRHLARWNYWRSILDEYESSFMDPDSFCESNRISKRSFCKWRNRLSLERENNGGLDLVPVDNLNCCIAEGAITSMKSMSGISILYGGVVIQLERDFDSLTLAKTLAVIRGEVKC